MIKYKKWIDGVERVRNILPSRLDCVRLDKNERITPFSPRFEQKIKHLFQSKYITAYPETEKIYSKLADHLGFSEKNIVLTNGSDGAIRLSFDLCVDKGDKVVILDPTFAMIEVYCKLFGAQAVKIRCETDLSTDPNKILNAIDDSVSLVVIANPNSPTGTYIPNKEIEKIISKAENKSIAVLIDEAYFGFCGETAVNFVFSHSNVLIARTFNKAWGIASLRAGYFLSSETIASLAYKFRPIYEINGMACEVLDLLLDNYDEVASYLIAEKEGREYIANQLKEMGLEIKNTSANFIHINCRAYHDIICKAFNENRILIGKNVKVPNYDGWIRLTTGPKEIMDIPLKIIRETLRLSQKKKNKQVLL